MNFGDGLEGDIEGNFVSVIKSVDVWSVGITITSRKIPRRGRLPRRPVVAITDMNTKFVGAGGHGGPPLRRDFLPNSAILRLPML